MLHHPAAGRIVPVVGGGEKGESRGLCLLQHRPGRLRGNPLPPVFLPQAIPQIMAVVRRNLHIADGDIILLPADGIPEAAGSLIELEKMLPEIAVCLRQIFHRVPGKEPVDLRIPEDLKKGRKISLLKPAQNQPFRHQGRRIDPERRRILLQLLQHQKRQIPGNFGSLAAVFLKGFHAASSGRVGDGAQRQKRHLIHIADMCCRGRFHIRRQRREPLKNLRPSFFTDKLFSRNHGPEPDPAPQTPGRSLCRRQKTGIGRETGRRHPGVKFRQNILRHIVIRRRLRCHRIKNFQPLIHASRSSRVDHRVHLKGIDKNLRGNGRVHLAHPAVQRHRRHALKHTLIEFQHGLFGDCTILHAGKKRFQLRIPRAQNPNPHKKSSLPSDDWFQIF